MNKGKFELLVFIFILAAGINYGVYTYYVGPGQGEIKIAQESYNSMKGNIEQAASKAQALNNLKSKVAEKKKEADSIDLIFDAPDNDTIIKDFYKACKDYDVKGGTLEFSMNGNTTGSGSSGTDSGSKDTDSILTGVQPQSITLTIEGEKGKVENFIDHVREVSSRKLLLTSVQINSEEAKGISLSNSTDTAAQKVSAKITLAEFIYTDAVQALEK